MDFDFKSIRAMVDLGVLGVIAWAYIKEKSGDTTNKQLMEKQEVQHNQLIEKSEIQHKEMIKEFPLLRSEINKLISVLSGKFVNKENFIDIVSLRFRDLQLYFYSKVDKNNIEKNYDDIMNEIDLLLEDKQNEIEKEIRKTGNNEIAKEVIKSLEIIFKEYKEHIHKLFYYYRENHEAGETKRAISNLTLNYIQRSREILEN